MYGFYQDGTYPPEKIRRHRRLIVFPSVLLIFAGAVLVAFGRYSFGNLAALVTLVALFSSALWWTMATKSSGPAKIDPNTIDYLKRLTKHNQNLP